jgi:hypothetical protein
MGFAVGEEMPSFDIELKINIKVDKVTSKTTEGLYWAYSTAVVSLKDMETGGIFATFSQFSKDGSYQTEEAKRRSLIIVGADSAPVIKQKLLDYVQKK